MVTNFTYSGGVMVNKLYKQTFTNESESQCGSHSVDLVPNLSKNLRKLQLSIIDSFFWSMIKFGLERFVLYSGWYHVTSGIAEV